jgi:hypothetical protein
VAADRRGVDRGQVPAEGIIGFNEPLFGFEVFAKDSRQRLQLIGTDVKVQAIEQQQPVLVRAQANWFRPQPETSIPVGSGQRCNRKITVLPALDAKQVAKRRIKIRPWHALQIRSAKKAL